LESNLGYAEGNNVGIRHALAQQPDYIFVLNNDTLLEPTMLTHLVQIAETDTTIGMVGPKMYCTEPRDKIFAAGSFVRWWEGELEHRGMFQTEIVENLQGQPELVDFITGCGVLVRRKLIEKIGMLDHHYYLNFEDVEWAIRAWRNGYQVIYMPQAVMWHKVSATLGQGSAANTYYMTRNALRFFWSNGSGLIRWLAVTRILLRTIRTMSSWTINFRYHTPAFRKKRQANLMALRDFFWGRFGPMGPDVYRVCYEN
jgi:GT2 family glycosyltransferase